MDDFPIAIYVLLPKTEGVFHVRGGFNHNQIPSGNLTWLWKITSLIQFIDDLLGLFFWGGGLVGFIGDMCFFIY